MNVPTHPTVRWHLRAAVIALTVAAVSVGAGLFWARRVERLYGTVAAHKSESVKDLGVAWQEECFAQPDLLPFYGSSELIKRAPNKASQFFATYPTGFAVSPVGRASCTSLILLEKVGASGSDARGRKVVISISPSWFLARGAMRDGFDGNFSAMQASLLFFESPLSLRLKHAIASQMLRYSEVFDRTPLISLAAHCLASERWQDHLVYFAAIPLGRLENLVYRLQDHFELVNFLREDHRRGHLPRPATVSLDWDRLIAEAGSLVPPLPEDLPDARLRQFANDEAFQRALQRSVEWDDLELLLRTVRELDLDPLLISMPIEYQHFERMGISQRCIDAYVWRLHDFASRYEVPVVDFAELGEDPQFFEDHFGHPSAKGWAYMNRAVDDFFHGRPARARESAPPGEQIGTAEFRNPRTDRPRLPPSEPWLEIPGT